MIATVQGFWDYVLTIPNSILDGIKSIFIPDTEDINQKIETLSSKFVRNFGIEAYDLSEVLGTETEIANQEGTVRIGDFKFSGTFLDVSYIVTAVNTFRPYIRGFITLLLVFYNIQQFLSLIQQSKIEEGSNQSFDFTPVKPSLMEFPRLKG